MIKKIFTLSLCTFFFNLTPNTAKAEQAAGIILFPSLVWQQQTGLLSGDQNVFGLDLRAGYLIPAGFYFGLIYCNHATGGTNSVTQSRLGNTVGYFYDMFSLAFSFFLMANSSETTPTASTERSEGTGMQLDFAVSFPVTTFFKVGPMLSYRSLTYNKRQDSGGVLVTTAQSQVALVPSLGLLFTF